MGKGFGMDLFNLWSDIRLDSTSDHRSLTLDLRCVQDKKKPFRFRNSWLEKDEIHEVVQNAWQINIKGTAMYMFTKKLGNFKKTLKR